MGSRDRAPHRPEQARQPLEDQGPGALGDLIDLHVTDMNEVLRAPRRSKAFTLRCTQDKLGKLKLKDLTREGLIQFGKGRAKGGAGPVTIRMDIGYIELVVSHASAVHAVRAPIEPTDVARIALKRPGLVGKGRERDRRPTLDELQALADCFASDSRQIIPLGRIMRFAVATAMRQDEICRIRWGVHRCQGSYRHRGRPEDWAAAGFKDTLLRWQMKPEVAHGNEKAVQLRVKLEAVKLVKERGVAVAQAAHHTAVDDTYRFVSKHRARCHRVSRKTVDGAARHLAALGERRAFQEKARRRAIHVGPVIDAVAPPPALPGRDRFHIDAVPLVQEGMAHRGECAHVCNLLRRYTCDNRTHHCRAAPVPRQTVCRSSRPGLISPSRRSVRRR